jgi:energy-coupling factor transport system substrate-specific component
MDSPLSQLDEVTIYLRALRGAAGEPPYGELTEAVVEERIARGLSPRAAQVEPAAVVDAFEHDHRPADPALVGDLIRALGGSPEEAADWRGRAGRIPPSPAGRAPGSPASGPPATGARGLLLAACLVLNLLGRVFVLTTHVPLYLDMIGTAIAAFVAGPWAGALVGASTSMAGVAIAGWTSAPFAPVEIVGALIWGYGVRRLDAARTVPRFFLLNLVVALGCSIVAVPIIVWLDHGFTGSGADAITRSMRHVWHSLLWAVGSQNLITSIADKLLSGFCALAAWEALPPRLRERGPQLELRAAGRATATWIVAALDARGAAQAMPSTSRVTNTPTHSTGAAIASPMPVQARARPLSSGRARMSRSPRTP